MKNIGCVYFFKHVGLSPVKIGYSENESPESRFKQFKTYAPFGAELLGFIPSDNARKLELYFHNKYAQYRLKGEWFELTLDQIDAEIKIHTEIEAINIRNNMKLDNLMFRNETSSKKEHFLREYHKNKPINVSQVAKRYKVSRMAVYKWMKAWD